MDSMAQRRRHGAAHALEITPFCTKPSARALGLLPEVCLFCLSRQRHWCLSARSAYVATVLQSLLPVAPGLSEPGSSPTPPRRLMCTLTSSWGVRVREPRSRPHRGSSWGRGAGAAAAAGGPGGTRLLRAAPRRASLRTGLPATSGLVRTRVLSATEDDGGDSSQGTR